MGLRTVPQIFIHGRHVGGYEELAELEREGKLDAWLANAPEAQRLRRWRTPTRHDLLARQALSRRAGAAPLGPLGRRQSGSGRAADPARGARRRRLCADAGEHRADGAQARADAASGADRGGERARWRGFARSPASSASSCISARSPSSSTPTRVANRSYLHRPRRRDRRALRQAAYVRCRSCRRREPPRVCHVPPRRQGGRCRSSLRPARALHLLRPPLPAALPRARHSQARSSSPSPPPSPSRPARPIGMC